jgi:hypothetical protein
MEREKQIGEVGDGRGWEEQIIWDGSRPIFTIYTVQVRMKSCRMYI